MRIAKIKATGNFLSTYYTDLLYIRNFQRFKRGEISIEDYSKKKDGSFYAFLIEFRVIRNIHKGKVQDLLLETKKWTSKRVPGSVDAFAKHLKKRGITHGKIMTSLASKVLFLSDPWVIFPFDNLAKKSLKQKTNSYADYLPRIEKFKRENKKFSDANFKIISPYIKETEREFSGEIKGINQIRLNRFTDKLLWTGEKILDTFLTN